MSEIPGSLIQISWKFYTVYENDCQLTCWNRNCYIQIRFEKNTTVPNKGRSPNCGRVAAQIPHTTLLNLGFTGSTFTKILHDVVVLMPLLLHAFTRRIATHLRTSEQTLKAVNFNVCKWSKNQVVTIARSLGRLQNEC